MTSLRAAAGKSYDGRRGLSALSGMVRRYATTLSSIPRTDVALPPVRHNHRAEHVLAVQRLSRANSEVPAPADTHSATRARSRCDPSSANNRLNNSSGMRLSEMPSQAGDLL